MDRRIGRGAFFAVWAVLMGGQLAALANQASGPDAPGLQPLVVGVILVALQLLKFPITAWRLNDIGRPSSDAVFFVGIPVANIIGLLRYMIEPTPSEKAWNVRRRGWSNQIGPLDAVARAMPLVLRSAGVGIPVVVVYGVVMAGVGKWVLDFAANAAQMDPTTRSNLSQGFLALMALLLVYTVVQFAKRGTASRLSWFPSLFLVPTALIGLSLRFFDAGMQSNLQLILLTFIYMAWQLIWMSVGGAGLMVAVTLAAERVRTNQPLNAGEIFGQLGPRTLDVAGPHGTRVQAVTIGMQVIIPGIFYMLQLAFADAIAVLKPQAAALKESGQLTWGMRQRLFKLFFAMTLATMIIHFGITSLIDGPDQAMAYFIDPREMSFATFALGEVIWGTYAWVLQIALLLMYHDRVRYLEERRAERRAKRKAQNGEAPEPVEEKGPAVRDDDDWKRIAAKLDAVEPDAKAARATAKLDDAGLQLSATEGEIQAAKELKAELDALQSRAMRKRDPGQIATVRATAETHVLAMCGYLLEAIPQIDEARYLLRGEPALDYRELLDVEAKWSVTLENAERVHRMLRAELDSLRADNGG